MIEKYAKKSRFVPLFVCVDTDETSLIRCVADNMGELAKMVGVSEESIQRELNRKKVNRKMNCQYERVNLSREEFMDATKYG